MTPRRIEEGYLTIATGHQRYVELALNLVLSLRHKDSRPVALLHDRAVEIPPAYQSHFDILIDAEERCLLPGLDTKLLLQEYSPFERTIFLDADCLLAKWDADRHWEALRGRPFTVVGKVIRRGPYCRFPDVGLLTSRLGLPYMVRHNGGFMYFDQCAAARKLFRQARAYYAEHRDFLSYTHTDPARGHNEEPFFAAALALLGLKPLSPRENLMYTARKGPYDIDVLRGRCAYGADPVVSPTFPHFVRLEPRDVYVRNTSRLRTWFGLPPWFPDGADRRFADADPVLKLPAKESILDVLPHGGVVAEIGVFRGGFSQRILEATEPKTLHLVDAWEGDVSSGGVVAKGDDVHEAVLRRFEGPVADGRVVVHRQTSLEAAAGFEDGAFDWVFLDANHGYQGMKEDLEAWFPKVRPGGYVTGHDYV
ncbi:class I SAM-dependent methyltransferase, partial [bacterium]|nr:class I SAM-dependent methyltransferase [bacterium]